jgi:hypothetical protein
VERQITSPRSAPRTAGLHALLFAAYPVLFLWSQNAGIVSVADVIPPLLIVMAVAGVALLILARVLGDVRRAALIVTPAVLAFFLYGHVVDLLRPTDIPVRLQQVGWGVLVVAGVVGAVRLGEGWLRRLDTGLLRVGALLVLVTALTIVPSLIGDVTARNASLRPIDGDDPLTTTTDAPKRDVYWLVFDRYGSDRSLELMYGVENDLTPWLRERGFTVLSDSHANYVKSALSMATTLELTHLEEVARLMGPDSTDFGPPYASLQESRTVRQFKALGYRYHHVGSWWSPTRVSRTADVNHNLDDVSDFTAGLLDSSVVPTIQRLLGGGRRTPLEARHYEHALHGLAALESLRDEPGPKFVLAHVLLPHPPYVFDRDGRFIPEEEANALTVPERWERQLAYTNERLRTLLGGLLALPPEERPIIILQADEGPWIDPYLRDSRSYDWSTASADELEIKFGIMNAWYLPGAEDLALDPAMTSINTFSTLFSRYFGLDYDPLPDRVFTSRSWDHPYDLTDVTDRLPLPSPDPGP